MDGCCIFFSPASITDEIKRFEYVVTVNDDETYTETDKYVSSTKAANAGGVNFNKSGFVGTSKSYCKTISFGRDKKTGKIGIVSFTFNSEEYKKPVKELMKNSGYKKKAWPIGKYIIGATICFVILTIALIILIASQAPLK